VRHEVVEELGVVGVIYVVDIVDAHMVCRIPRNLEYSPRRKPMPLNKRKKIEEKLGRSLRSYLTDRFLEGATQGEAARELGLDPATIRYYIKKWHLPYIPRRVRQKKAKEARLKRNHLEVCICPLCQHEFCEEARKSHHHGRCVMSCRVFEGRLTVKSARRR